MKRSKNNSAYWDKRFDRVFKEVPGSENVEIRYRTLRYVLIEKYPEIITCVSNEKMCEFLKDVVYLDRQLRLKTEGSQNKKKKFLSDSKKSELGYVTKKELKKIKEIQL